MSIFLGCLNVFHSIPAALENLGQRCSLLAHSIGKWQIEKWQKLQETADVSDVSASIFSFDHCARLRCTKYCNMLHSTMNEESTRSTRSARKKSQESWQNCRNKLAVVDVVDSDCSLVVRKPRAIWPDPSLSSTDEMVLMMGSGVI